MRSLTCLTLVAGIAAVACGKGKSAPPRDEPALAESNFGVESAKITFKHSGRQEGTTTAWFTGRGATVAVFTDLTKPIVEKRHVVWKDGKATGWREGAAPYTSAVRSKDTELRAVVVTESKALAEAGFAKQPNAMVAGKDCDVLTNEKTQVTLWRWQGIDLKYTNGEDTVEATEVITPSDLPAEMLAPSAASAGPAAAGSATAGSAAGSGSGAAEGSSTAGAGSAGSGR